jgi:phosphate-selective porin OprO/OprP
MGIMAETFEKAWDMPWTLRGGLTTESVGAPAPGNSSGNTTSGNTNRNDLSGNISYQLVGRATIAPIKTETTLLHTGAWGSWRSVNNNYNPNGTLRTGGWAYQSQPDTDVDRTNFVNTGNLTNGIKGAPGSFRANDIDMFGAELAGSYGPVHLESEYMRAQVIGSGYQSGNVLQGYYVQGGWFLTGESRPYDEKKGTWGRLIPFHNFSVTDSGWGWGAWEIAYRYDLIDMNTRNVNGGSVNAGTLGVNWYLTPRVRFMTNWVHVFATNNGLSGKCTYPASGANAPIACFNGVTPNVWEAAVRIDF